MVVAGTGPPTAHSHHQSTPKQSKASVYKHPSLPSQTQQEDRRLGFSQTGTGAPQMPATLQRMEGPYKAVLEIKRTPPSGQGQWDTQEEPHPLPKNAPRPLLPYLPHYLEV